VDDLRRAGDAVALVVEGYKADEPVLYKDVPPKAVLSVVSL
jgi:hypothetical protein